MADIRIKGDGTHVYIHVDGQQINHLCGATLTMDASSLPVLDLKLAALSAKDVQINGAHIVIRGAEMPEQLELALLEYLVCKYPLTAAVKRLAP